MEEKKRYDFDYTTQFKKEYYYLREHNVRAFISVKDDETGVITFRYRRSSRLFKTVAEFYEKYENERMFDTISKMVEAVQNAKKTQDGKIEENPFEGILNIDPKIVEMLMRPKQKAAGENDDHRE